MASLAALDLTGCRRIFDAGLAKLQGAPLTDLSLQGCVHVSDHAVRSLITGKQLKCLNLRYCRKITAGEILPALMSLPLVKLVLSKNTLSEADLEGLILGVASIEEVHVYSESSSFGADNMPRILLGLASGRGL